MTNYSGPLPFDDFQRAFLHSDTMYSTIGAGAVGGKAAGLARIFGLLQERIGPEDFPGISVAVPRFAVLTTEVYDEFMSDADLDDWLASEPSDERIAARFLSLPLPARFAGDLWALGKGTRQPLAVRSSSLLEDAKEEPFAGIYETKMIPNNQPSDQARFRGLADAIKFVWASTHFLAAREYRRATGHPDDSEKMAVIIQEVVGSRHSDRFYPELSAVARSFNCYPFGHAKPDDGVLDLALGLGKAVVDGGPVWTVCPSYPRSPPPLSGIGDLLKNTQRRFWAIGMGPSSGGQALGEAEYLVEGDLSDADYDDTLGMIASTLVESSGRLQPGTGAAGTRILDFAPLLQLGLLPFAGLIRRLLALGKEEFQADVEIELAMDGFADEGPAKLGFLQVRPMKASRERVEIGDEEARGAFVCSDRALGNGEVEGVRHLIFVKPDTFDPKYSIRVAEQIGELNRDLSGKGLPYVLLGFGRWGSSDPWLGVPVRWGQISGAVAIVELTSERMNVDLSQGSHFFHNLSAFGVSYLSVRHSGPGHVDWAWLERNQGIVLADTGLVRCMELPEPLRIKVDGRTGKGAILK